MCRRGHRQACAGIVARSRAALAKGPQADEAQCEAGRTGRVQAMSLRGSRSTTIAGLHRQCGGKWWCSRMRESTHGSNLEIRPGPERRLTCCARIDRVPAPDVTRHSPIAQLRSLHFLCARVPSNRRSWSQLRPASPTPSAASTARACLNPRRS